MMKRYLLPLLLIIPMLSLVRTAGAQCPTFPDCVQGGYVNNTERLLSLIVNNTGGGGSSCSDCATATLQTEQLGTLTDILVALQGMPQDSLLLVLQHLDSANAYNLNHLVELLNALTNSGECETTLCDVNESTQLILTDLNALTSFGNCATTLCDLASVINSLSGGSTLAEIVAAVSGINGYNLEATQLKVLDTLDFGLRAFDNLPWLQKIWLKDIEILNQLLAVNNKAQQATTINTNPYMVPAGGSQLVSFGGGTVDPSNPVPVNDLSIDIYLDTLAASGVEVHYEVFGFSKNSRRQNIPSGQTGNIIGNGVATQAGAGAFISQCITVPDLAWPYIEIRVTEVLIDGSPVTEVYVPFFVTKKAHL